MDIFSGIIMLIDCKLTDKSLLDEFSDDVDSIS